jgi:hypothetical protein
VPYLFISVLSTFEKEKKTERFLHASARGGISRRRIIREQRRRRPRIINGTGTVTAPQASMQSPGKGNKAAASPTLLFNSHGSAGLNFPARHSAPHLSSCLVTLHHVRGRFRCRHSSKNSTTFLRERRRSRQDRACMCSRGRSTRLAGI